MDPGEGASADRKSWRKAKALGLVGRSAVEAPAVYRAGAPGAAFAAVVNTPA